MKKYLILLQVLFLSGCVDSLVEDYTHCKILSSTNPDLVSRSEDQSQCFGINFTFSKTSALNRCEYLTNKYMYDKYGKVFEHVNEVLSERC
jgi:hypothetical protein